MADGIGNFSKIAMEATVAIIILAAVAIPIIASMPAATGTNADIINNLIAIIPVILAVAVIVGIVYAAILRRRS